MIDSGAIYGDPFTGEGGGHGPRQISPRPRKSNFSFSFFLFFFFPATPPRTKQQVGWRIHGPALFQQKPAELLALAGICLSPLLGKRAEISPPHGCLADGFENRQRPLSANWVERERENLVEVSDMNWVEREGFGVGAGAFSFSGQQRFPSPVVSAGGLVSRPR